MSELQCSKRKTLSRTAVAINMDLSSKYIVVSLDDMTVHTFNPEGDLLHILKHEAIVFSLTLQDDILLCGGVGGNIQSWDLSNGSASETFIGHRNTVRCLAFTDPSSFVSASRDATLKAWSLKTVQKFEPCFATLNVETTPIISLAFDCHTNLVAFGCEDGTCRIWDLSGQASSASTLSGHEGAVRSVVISTDLSAESLPQTTQIVTGGTDGQVKMWNARTGSLIRDLDGHTGLVRLILAARHGSDNTRILVTAGVDGLIKVWEISGTPQLRWVQKQAHVGGVTSMDSSDEHLITGGADGKIKVWELQTGRLVSKLGDDSDAIFKAACKQGGVPGFVVVSRQSGSTCLDIFPVS